MALVDDLRDQIGSIFKSQWTKRDGRVVPEPKDVGLGNDVVEFDRATVLYADLTASTQLVDTEKWHFAAEVYKAYLYSAARIINSEGGQITSYDGDRIMGVFIGDTQSTTAVRCALKINWAVREIVNPALKEQYPNQTYVVRQVIGIDTSPLRAARTGARGDNDLVWVGRAANHAAKLTNIKEHGPTWITDDVFKQLADTAKYGGTAKKLMWEPYLWKPMNNASIHSSNWRWTV